MESNKRLILKLSKVLLSVLLFLTFLSNTIYSFNLPGVTADYPTAGIIMRTHRAEGTVDFSENIYLYAEVAGKISLEVREGETVSEGDNLFTLHSDTDDLRDRLLAETNRLEKLSIDMEKTERELRYKQNILSELTLGSERITEVAKPDTDGLDYELKRIGAEMERAEGEYQSLLLLYEAGGATREALTGMEEKLSALEMEYRRNEEQKGKALSDYERAAAKAAEDDKRYREEQLKTYETERQLIIKAIEDMRYQMDSYVLDENEILRAIDRLNKQIDAGGVVTVQAESGGVVREIPAGVESGAYMDRNRQVMRMGVISAADKGFSYRTSVLFPESVDFLLEGNNIMLNIKSSGQYGINGVIDKLGYENGRIRADIMFDALSIKGGERVEAVAELVSPLFEMVLPNSAVRKDKDGYYILYVERISNSIMGYSYYARRLPATILLQDEQKTAIFLLSDNKELIIINSDRPVADGDRIRMVSGNELVETR